jgi:hypothetical protein
MMVAFSIRLDRIDESLLYEAKDGSFWLSCVCSYDEDAKGRTVVAQSISKERFAAGERGPQVGHWREIGNSNPKPAQAPKPKFDMAKYRATAKTQTREGAAGANSETPTTPTQAGEDLF